MILCIAAASFSYAQNSATEGKEFYLNFTSNYNQAASNAGLSLIIRYVVSDTCYITAQYGDGTYLDNNALYLPGTYNRMVDKPKCYTQPMTMGMVTNNLFVKITSTQNIGVYGISMFAATTDATTILPVDALGSEYTIISNTGGNPSSISVIATVPGTIITIRDAAGTALVSNLSISTGMVNIYSMNSPVDITGYTVESNNDVAVFVATQCGSQYSCGACDHNWEQMWPTNTAGRNYLVWCMSPSCYDNIKVVALEDNTTITRKIGGATTSFTLNKHQINAVGTPTNSTGTTYINNSGGVVEFTSDKPFIIDHILGHAPCIKWISPIEQRVTTSVISPFVPTGGSVITTHNLHIIIPADAESNMEIKEVRNGVETYVVLPFYTNTTNPDFKIAYKEYLQYDSVLIYLNNPGGFLAYITGHGNAESYIMTAGAGAFDLSAYFTVDNMLYQAIDNTILCDTGVRVFESTCWGAATTVQGYLKWYINNVEELAARDSVTWSKSLDTGTYTIRMDVLDLDSILHQYTTTFTVSAITSILTHPSTVADTMCENSGNFPPLSVTAAGTNLSYQWYRNTTASYAGGVLIVGETNATYSPPSSLATGDYYYYCIVTGDCGTDTSNVSGKHTISTISTHTANITASDNNICSGTSITFTAYSNMSGSLTYQWKKDGISISGAINSTYSYAPDNGDMITCEITSSDPCANPATAISNTITMIVTPKAVPSITIQVRPN